MMSHRSLHLAVSLLLVCLLMPSVSLGQNATIGVYRYDDGASACPMAPGESALLAVKLVHTAGPVKTAKFKLVPSCPGATINGALDYDLTFAGCKTDGDLLVLLFVTAPATCDIWGFYFDVTGPNGEFSIPMTDCNGYGMTAVDALRSIDGPPCDDLSSLITGYRPFPEDGATNVPVNTLLTYVGYANAIQLSSQPLTGEYDDHVMCGPAYCFAGLPNLAACEDPVDPGPLAPNTKYYWQISTHVPTHEWCISARSTVFTFTTANVPVKAAPATWGYVKSIYRD